MLMINLHGMLRGRAISLQDFLPSMSSYLEHTLQGAISVEQGAYRQEMHAFVDMLNCKAFLQPLIPPTPTSDLL